jgi:1-acyl-sn-glycerol-3-phosphate acyltransferase
MWMEKPLYWLSRPVADTYTTMMLRMDVQHKQLLPRGAKIIAANHPSTTDPFYLAAMMPGQTYILINDLLFKIPVLGKYLHHTGHIPVTAGRGQQAIDSALELLARGKTIIIFPEGDLSPVEGGFLQSRTGVARLALASGAPVIPVGIHLDQAKTKKVHSEANGEPEEGRLYLTGPYAMTFGTPLRFKGNVEDRPYVRKVADHIMHHIIELAAESQSRYNRPSGFFSTVGSILGL